MERTHLLSDDLDWLPVRFRALRWLAAGAAWTGALASSLLFLALLDLHHFGEAMLGTVASGWILSDVAARAAMRRRLRKLAHGQIPAAQLPAEADGELVHVAGRVRYRSVAGARAQLHGLISNLPAVYRRITFKLDGRIPVVHEAAVDFYLEGEGGELILIETAEARLLAGELPNVWIHDSHPARAALETLPLPPSMQRELVKRRKRRDQGRRVPKISANEMLVVEGEQIEVLGYKSQVIDPMLAERLERDTPMRITLRGGSRLPLLIVSPI